MRKEYQVGRGTLDDSGDVAGLSRPEPDAGDIQWDALDVDARPRISQDGDAGKRQGRRHRLVIVVVAEDCEDAVWRVERRERFRGLPDPPSIDPASPRHVVAAEHDDVGPLGHQQVDRRSSELRTDGVAAVKIRDKADAEAVEFWGQTTDANAGAGETDAMACVDVTVVGGADDSSDGSRSGASEQVAPRERGRLLRGRHDGQW